MMIFYTDIKIEKTPIVTFSLIAAIVVVFLILQVFNLNHLSMDYGLMGSFYSIPSYNLITNLFLHYDVLHFASNIWILYFLGRIVEDKFSSLYLISLFFFGGISASMIYLFINQPMPIPLTGASSAIFSLMPSILFYYPRNKIYSVLQTFGFFIPFFSFLSYIPIVFSAELIKQIYGALYIEGKTNSFTAFSIHLYGFFMGSIWVFIYYLYNKYKEKRNLEYV